MNHTFAIRVAGTAPFDIQWFKNGVALEQAVHPELRLTSVHVSDAGEYSVTVRNVAGSATAAARLDVQEAPAFRITREPEDRVHLPGEDAVFEVTFQGAEGATRQWFHRNRPIPGATGDRLVIPHLRASDSGEYFIEARLGAARRRSRIARLDVMESGPPWIVSPPPEAPSSHPGDSGFLAVRAVGWGDLSFAWTHDGEPIVGEHERVLVLAPDIRSGGSFGVEVRDPAGRRAEAQFTVIPVLGLRLAGQVNPAGRFEVSSINGPPGKAYSLLRSTDLMTWRGVAEGVVPEGGRITFEESVPPGLNGPAYYRVRIHP